MPDASRVVARGRLLVASPRLQDPNFDRSVVLVLEHDQDGTLGLVLNRPTITPVAEILAPWAECADQAPPAVVFGGGPVSPDVAVGLAGLSTASDDPGSLPVVGRIGLVDLSTAPSTQALPVMPVRVFAGYAGWGPGQLGAEMAEGAWFVVDAQAQDLVAKEPADLWRSVLRRQGDGLRMLAAFPADVTLN